MHNVQQIKNDNCNLVIHMEKKTKCNSCEHCNYDYTQEKGMLFDEEKTNRIYIVAFKKWQQQPCEFCDKHYVKYLYEITNREEKEYYEYELMMEKYYIYLDSEQY